MRVVLDTNVIVSGVISPAGPPDAILRAWRRGSVQLIISAPLLVELTDVLARPRIRKRTGFTSADEAALIAELSDTAIIVAPAEQLAVLTDPDDNRLLEAALAGHADYIVSGDSIVVGLASFREVQLVTPSRFLALLTAEPQAD
ncbi:MAG: putative toxin-antitoxin system toxin component, PIN family [Dehalococcoidia bacterium]